MVLNLPSCGRPLAPTFSTTMSDRTGWSKLALLRERAFGCRLTWVLTFNTQHRTVVGQLHKEPHSCQIELRRPRPNTEGDSEAKGCKCMGWHWVTWLAVRVLNVQESHCKSQHCSNITGDSPAASPALLAFDYQPIPKGYRLPARSPSRRSFRLPRLPWSSPSPFFVLPPGHRSSGHC
jgi:hypothetical protein